MKSLNVEIVERLTLLTPSTLPNACILTLMVPFS